jgi:hypothetical protein
MSLPKTNPRNGAVLPLLAVLLPVLLIMTSIVVNMAYIELTRTELRAAVDSAARAAGHRLIQTGKAAEAHEGARQAGLRNQVASEALQFSPQHVEIGTSVRESEAVRYSFTPGGIRPNAARVTGLRTEGSLSGPVAMVFPTFGMLNRFQPTQSATSTQAEIDIALVLDRSGSMAYSIDEDSNKASKGMGPKSAPKWKSCDAAPPKSRWLDLVAAVDVFVEELNLTQQRERLALCTYSSTAQDEVDLTENYSKVLAGVDKYTKKFCGGSTAIGDGVESGHNAVLDRKSGRSWVGKALGVMTDGNHNTGRDPVAPAGEAYRDGAVVYTITFSDEADIQRMQKTAAAGGGLHFHASSREELIEAFREIIKSLPTLLTR